MVIFLEGGETDKTDLRGMGGLSFYCLLGFLPVGWTE